LSRRKEIVFRSILVPLDGSTFAEHALPLAASLARRTGASLRLLQIIPTLADLCFWVPPPGDPFALELHQRNRAAAEGYLEDVGRRLQSAGAGPATGAVVEGELGIAESVRAHAAAVGADLVAMTTHGRGPLARWWLGSVADELLRSLSAPVLLVRPGEAAPNLGEDVVLRHLLLALDGTALAERVLEPAVDVGKAMGADLTLVRVVPPALPSGFAPAAPAGIETIGEGLRQQADHYLQKVAESLRAGGMRVQTRVIAAEHPGAAILELAAAGIDLIALETHGRRRLSRLLLGSVADKVVRGSSLPVLVGRAAGP
jgi:nucleotide-binding universal stress UspA family protein